LRPLNDGSTSVQKNGLNSYRTTDSVFLVDEKSGRFLELLKSFFEQGHPKFSFREIWFLIPFN
jgi:hypothetical protein